MGAGIKTPITRVIAMRLRFIKLDYALYVTLLAVSTKTSRSIEYANGVNSSLNSTQSPSLTYVVPTILTTTGESPNPELTLIG